VVTKRFTVSARIGEAGMALIGMLVAEMGFIWHPRRVDHGIDGEIELVSPDGAALNRVLLVQSKATDRRFVGEDDLGFWWTCDESDIGYWLAGNAPVLLVCSHPASREAWWVAVKQALADPATRSSRRVRFDKRRDRLDASAAGRLLELAVPISEGTYLRPPPRPEVLLTNLLRVDYMADVVWSAPTRVADRREGYERLRAAGPVVSDWVLWGGEVYSFRRLGDAPLAPLADGPTRSTPTRELATSKSEDARRLLVQVLNRTVEDAHADQLRWHGKRNYLYFRATEDLSPLTIKVDGGTGRTVFSAHPSKRDPSRVAYYRHYALERQFLHLDGAWHLELNPTYHYTWNGIHDSRWAAGYLAGIKQLEGHSAVRRLTTFWAGYLRGPRAPGLFDQPPDTRLRFGRLAEFPVNQGIDDDAWKPLEPSSDANDNDDPGGNLSDSRRTSARHGRRRRR
jgi:Domain of unknown function (DUF4365)